MIKSTLYTIVYNLEEDKDNLNAFFTVGVDMDHETATKLAIQDYKNQFAIEGTDDENLSDEHFLGDLGVIGWREVPETIDNFDIEVVDKE